MGALLAWVALALLPKTALATPALAEGADARRTAAALADLARSLLRESGPVNAVVSPLAAAVALGLVQSGASGAAEHEIEALFGPGPLGARATRHTLPALLRQVQGQAGASSSSPSLSFAARMWIDTRAAPGVPQAYAKRLVSRWQADAVQVSFAQSEATREQINHWTAQHTAGRIPNLLPAGSVNSATRMALTAAVHFRSAWEKPFDAALTVARPFKTALGESKPVPTMVDERGVLQARLDGQLVMEIPFAPAGGAFALLVVVPEEGTTAAVSFTGAQLARWRAALTPVKCELALPKFSILPRSGSLKTALQAIGVKTVFTEAADLRPMLGRSADPAHLDDVHHAAGITIDEQGGVAVAAVAATVRAKSLALPLPSCAVDRAFSFAIVHQPSGMPVFVGRLADPTLAE